MKALPAFFRTRLLIALLTIGIQLAHADAEPDLNISTPAILLLKKSMANRFMQLRTLLEAGVIGFTQDGIIALHDATTVEVNALLALDALIVAENKDRSTLYREIARANNHAEWESDLRAIFGKRWISRMPAGWFYRDDKGLWVKKE